VGIAARAKAGLRVLYVRTKFPNNCQLAPGQQRQSASSISVRASAVWISACFARCVIGLACCAAWSRGGRCCQAVLLPCHGTRWTG